MVVREVDPVTEIAIQRRQQLLLGWRNVRSSERAQVAVAQEAQQLSWE